MRRIFAAAAPEDAGERPWEDLDDFWAARDEERAAGAPVTWVEGAGDGRGQDGAGAHSTAAGPGVLPTRVVKATPAMYSPAAHWPL